MVTADKWQSYIDKTPTYHKLYGEVRRRMPDIFHKNEDEILMYPRHKSRDSETIGENKSTQQGPSKQTVVKWRKSKSRHDQDLYIEGKNPLKRLALRQPKSIGKTSYDDITGHQ